MVNFFFAPNAWQMMSFLNPLDALIPKIPFSFFLPIFGSGSPPRPGGLGRILRVPSIEPLLGWRGGLARGLYRPPPLPIESPPAPGLGARGCLVTCTSAPVSQRARPYPKRNRRIRHEPPLTRPRVQRTCRGHGLHPRSCGASDMTDGWGPTATRRSHSPLHRAGQPHARGGDYNRS